MKTGVNFPGAADFDVRDHTTVTRQLSLITGKMFIIDKNRLFAVITGQP